MTVRSQLIRWALRLQFPPFLWMFRAYYGLAVGLCRFLVSRVEGVKSIYLSGSWARGEVIYGLSDIDFKVFVAGDKNQKTYDTIRRRFSFLRNWNGEGSRPAPAHFRNSWLRFFPIRNSGGWT